MKDREDDDSCNEHEQLKSRRGAAHIVDTARESARIVVSYPSTVLWPLLMFGLIMGLGMWGVMHIVSLEEDNAKERASSLALDIALWFQSRVRDSQTPAQLLARLVEKRPDYLDSQNLFHMLAPVLLAQTTYNATVNVEMVPNGVITDVYPREGNEKALGLDLFASPNRVDWEGALVAARDHATTMVGPMVPVRGGWVLIIRAPVFVPNSDANRTFGAPTPPISPVCGAPCQYNATTRTAFWGYVASMVSLSVIMEAADSPLRTVVNLGYNYEVVALGISDPKLGTVAASPTPPRDPVESYVEMPNDQWVVRVSTSDGWRPSYFPGLVAAVVAIALGGAVLLFAVLLSRRRHKMLLEALLPKRIIRDLTPTTFSASRGVEPDTPADLLLDMMALLLDGHVPDLRDVLFIRTTLLQNLDVYQPLNLKNHIKGANLDADVTQALVQQLVGTGARWTPSSAPGEVGPATEDQIPDHDCPSTTTSTTHMAKFATTSGIVAFVLDAVDPAVTTAQCGSTTVSPLPSLVARTGHLPPPQQLQGATPGAALLTLLGGLPSGTGTEEPQPKPPRPFHSTSCHSVVSKTGAPLSATILQFMKRSETRVSSRNRPTMPGNARVAPGGVSPGGVVAAADSRKSRLRRLRGRSASSDFETGPELFAGAPDEGAQPVPSRGALTAESAVSLELDIGDEDLITLRPPKMLHELIQSRPSSAIVPAPEGASLAALPCLKGEQAVNSSINGDANNNMALVAEQPQQQLQPMQGLQCAPVMPRRSSFCHGEPALRRNSPRQGRGLEPRQTSTTSDRHITLSLEPRTSAVAAGTKLLSLVMGRRRSVDATDSDLATRRLGRLGSRLQFTASPCANGSATHGGQAGEEQQQRRASTLPAVLCHVEPPPSLPVLRDRVQISQVEKLLAQVDSWQYDMWALQRETEGHALSVLGFFLMQRSGLIKQFRLSPARVARFLRFIEAGYLDNPYHNATHAADVLQTLHVIIHATQLNVHYLDHLGLLGAYLAAIVHDWAHPGLTGDYLVATSDPLAVLYNDRSPLENHHCAASFGLMRQRPDLDFLAPLSKQDKSTLRKQVIDLVLATDMKQHFSILSHFNTVHRISSSKSSGGGLLKSAPGGRLANMQAEFNEMAAARGSAATASPDSQQSMRPSAPQPLDDSERLLSLQVAVKCADVGHLGEAMEVHKRWLALLEEEFFRQGDKERQLGLPISPLFDRSKQGVSKSQVGFYEFVALPLVQALSSAFPGAMPLKLCFKENYNHWKAIAAATPESDASTGGGSPGKS